MVAFLIIWFLVGLASMIFYLHDLRDERNSDKYIVAAIALFLPPVFWLLKWFISAAFKL